MHRPTILEARIRNIVREAIQSHLLTESQESKSISAAKDLVMDKLGYDEKRADDFVRYVLRKDLPVLRTKQGGKFILGAARMYCNGELRDATTINDLNTTLKYVVASAANYEVYDRDLNGLSAHELIDRFAKNIEADFEKDKSEVNGMQFGGNSNYDIVKIDSFEQAEEYESYADWCVTHDEYTFDSYTANGINQFYFCFKKGFENVPKEQGDGCPLDEYGLSMIAVLVNENGALRNCTCRWNHEKGADDNVMTAKQVSQVIGVNFYEVFKPNTLWKDSFENAMRRLSNGEDFRKVFDTYHVYGDGSAVVELNGRYNIIDSNNQIVCGQWFDECYGFQEGAATVELNGRWFHIGQDGQPLYSQRYEFCAQFYEGAAVASLNGKYFHIDKNGNPLYERRFDTCGNFSDGIAVVTENEKCFFIDKDGEQPFDTEFDYCAQFIEGAAAVRENNSWYHIDTNGVPLYSKRFDWCGSFDKGLAIVRLNGRLNFINKEGRLLSPNRWFDICKPFKNGVSEVYLGDGSHMYLDMNGNLSYDRPSMGESIVRSIVRECVENVMRKRRSF